MTVEEKDLVSVMLKVRDLRAWALRFGINPWALRQGLVMALEMDTAAAIERGIPKDDLDNFDKLTRVDINSWIKLMERLP